MIMRWVYCHFKVVVMSKLDMKEQIAYDSDYRVAWGNGTRSGLFCGSSGYTI